MKIFDKLTLDGDTILPPVFSVFGMASMLMGFRLMALRVFPYQRTTDAGYWYAVAMDVVAWVLIRFIYAEDKNMQAGIGTFISPAGPWYILVVFMPQQFLFLLSLCFRREVPFHAGVYSTFLLLLFCLGMLYFNIFSATNDRFYYDASVSSKLPESKLLSFFQSNLPDQTTMECDDSSYAATFLLTICGTMVSVAAYRSSKDRLNGLLLCYSFLGFMSWANCAKNLHDKGLAIVTAEISTYLIVKFQRIFLKPGTGFKKLSKKAVKVDGKRDSFYFDALTDFGNFGMDEDYHVAKYYKKMESKDIKKVAIVLDGFVGPNAVICGISRSYEAWIFELINQGIKVVIYSAFPAQEIENYFNSQLKFKRNNRSSASILSDFEEDSEEYDHDDAANKGTTPLSQNAEKRNVFKRELDESFKIKAYKLDALDIKYVEQVYYATRCNWRNIKMVSQSFHYENIDLVHVVFDGASVPIFSWACAWLRIPIVGIMHTDSIVICERNGFKFLAPLILMCQKLSGSTIESIATRSKSFAEQMLTLRNWKCDHVVKPHVRTEIFKPIKTQQVLDIRKTLTFADPNFDLQYNERFGTFNDGKLLMIYAGRFDIDKRVDELLELMKRLSSDPETQNIYLALIGGGSLGEDVAAMHGESNKVFCKPGFLSHEDLSLYYNAADFHISASQMETLGNTVLESLACGTPVVVPKAQGFIDTVTHRKNGLMWKPNDLNDAVSKIRELNSNRTLLLQLKKGAKDSIQDLHCSKAVEDLVNWYVVANENRRLRTLAVPRIVLASSILFGFFWFDFFIFSHAKSVLQSFSDKKIREKHRLEHLKEAS